MTSNNSKNSAQQRFGKFAQGYITSATHARGAELDRLVEIARPQSDWMVLDLATGGGHTALKFAPLVRHVIASDVSRQMLTAAQSFIAEKRTQNIHFVAVKAENIAFKEEKFNLLTCRIAPHHFADCVQFLQESTHVLKKGGLLLVQDLTVPDSEEAAGFVEKFESLRDPSHRRAFSPSQWQKMFQTVGLRVMTQEQIAKRHEFIPWVKRQGGTQDIIQRLTDMMEKAPPAVLEWMQPRYFGTPQATFVNRHIMIAGLKI